jgi:hypothetical protein
VQNSAVRRPKSVRRYAPTVTNECTGELIPSSYREFGVQVGLAARELNRTSTAAGARKWRGGDENPEHRLVSSSEFCVNTLVTKERDSAWCPGCNCYFLVGKRDREVVFFEIEENPPLLFSEHRLTDRSLMLSRLVLKRKE